jgi:hypothetical protein
MTSNIFGLQLFYIHEINKNDEKAATNVYTIVVAHILQFGPNRQVT